MARRITTVEKTAAAGGTWQDPYDQPCFSVFSQDNGGSNGFFCYTHRLDRHSFTFGTSESYGGNYRTYSDRAPEFWNDNSGSSYYQTNSHVQSNSEYPSMTCQVGYLGHQQFCPGGTNSSDGAAWTRHSRGCNYVAHAFTQVCPIVNETKQDYAIYTNHPGNAYTRMYFGPRSATMHYLGDNHYGFGRWSSCDIQRQWNDGEGSGHGGQGISCYNKKTKKLAVLETNTGYRFKPFVYSDVPNLRAVANNENLYYDKSDSYSTTYDSSNSSLRQWFNNATPAAYQPHGDNHGKPGNNTHEDNYRGVPVLCDNDKIVFFQMIPHNGAWICRWNADGTRDGGNLRHWSGTTSYGREQGERFGVRWQATSDGRYICAYCPYYYYGSGWLGAFIRVSDGKWLWDENTDTNYGYQVCPMGKSSFFNAHTYNTDSGHGLRHGMVNLDQQFAERGDGDRISSNMFFDAHSTIDTPYWSTAYPAIIPSMYNTELFTTQVEGGRGAVGSDKYDEFTNY